MQTSSQPKLLPIPFADAGSKQDIPNDSQIGIVAGRASYNDGFPPLTRTPLAGGGVPPFGTDFNGVFNDITAAIRWSQAGAGYPFNAAFNTAVAGYPKGARIPNSTLDGFWLNTTDGNSTNPENTTAALTGWVPSDNYGTTAITGLSGSSVTLTTLQASKSRITLAGTLTANINIIVPAWRKNWTVVNGATGTFSVTFKTPSGTGVAIPSGSTSYLVGDGTNITTDLGTAAFRSVGVGINQIPDMNSFASSLVAGGGYQKLPGGLIIQWGSGAYTNQATTSVTLPIAFPNAGFLTVASKGSGITLSGEYAVGSQMTSLSTISISNTGGTTGANKGIFWIALGY